MAGNLVEVQPSNLRDRTQLVGSAKARQERKHIECGTERIFEQLPVIAVFQPPSMFQVDLLPGRDRETNTAAGQRDLSSRRTSAASTRRPAATSDSD